MKRSTFAAMASVAVLAVSSQALAQFTLSPLATFGGGDGWRAPGEVVTGDAAGTTGIFGNYLYLNNDTALLERGIAFNPATGNLILVSRAPEANWIRILDGQTGRDKGPLSLGETGFITGGLFVRNMVGVTTDGVIYMGNLTINSASAPLKLYRWANEQAQPTVYYQGDGGISGSRLGDSLAVFGPDSGGRIALGFGSSPVFPGVNGFTWMPTGVESPTANAVTNLPLFTTGGDLNTSTQNGDFRLGITFLDADTVVGTQGAGVTGRIRVASFNGTSGTLDASPVLTLNPSIERGMSITEVDGRKLLATIGAGGFTPAVPPAAPSATQIAVNTVSVYDITDPAAPVLLATGKTVPVELAVSNGNGTASVAWGARVGNTISLYALNTNNGIQAFTLTLPSTPEFILGDFNFDGGLDGSDVDPFVLALSDIDTYLTDFASAFADAYPGLTLDSSVVDVIGDFNGDGGFDGSDVDGFVAALSGGRPGTAAIPEPAALGLLAPVAVLATRRRRD